jgi:hypothetical protein
MLTLNDSGREYGTASIEIHLKTCRKKWEEAESIKPAKDRRPVPQAPKSFDDVLINILPLIKY